MRRKSIEAQTLEKLRGHREALYEESKNINARIGGINDSISVLEDLIHRRDQMRKIKAADK